MKQRNEHLSGNLTIRQLEVFAMASRTPTFSEAAKRLGITQPSLSNTISKIEEQLGVSLFDRTTRSLCLTAAGERLAIAAEDLVKDFQAFLRGIGETADRHRGRMSMAVLPSVAMSIGPKALNLFFETYPDVDVALHDMTQEKSVAWVAERVVDFGIVAKANFSSELLAERIYEDEFQVICRKDDPLLKQADLNWKNLTDSALIMSGSAPIRRDIEAAWSRADRNLKPRFEVENIMTGLALVSAGLGVTILPSLYLPTVMEGGLTSFPLGDLQLKRELSVIRRTDKVLSKPAQHMIECFRSCFEAFEQDLAGRGAPKTVKKTVRKVRA